MADDRFSHVAKDPRFRQLNFKQKKVKIDKRFEGMFKDKKFKVKYSVDKRGRPVKTSTNDDLQRFYELSDSESSDEDNTDNDDKEDEEDLIHMKEKKHEKEETTKSVQDSKKVRGNIRKETRGERLKREKMKKREDNEAEKEEPSSPEDESDDEQNEDLDESSSSFEPVEEKDGIDLARGQGNVETSSSEESSEEEDSEEEEELEHKWGELNKEAGEVEDATSRLAVCNMDWDRIKAQDLLVLFNSFKPVGGTIHSVTIYPSEFGLERLKEEDMLGPKELRENKGNNEDDEEYHREKLRKYQLNRLKYYYAVVQCDSKNTAEGIYNECDGLEYESSASVVDLRFIPEDMTFEQEPKDVAKDLLDSSVYKPTLFTTSALQQSHVNLTWDETDQDRLTVLRKKYTKEDLEKINVDQYLASDSGEEETADLHANLEPPEFGEASSEDDEEQIQKYRELLMGGRKDEEQGDKDMEMEFTWEPGLEGSSQEADENQKEKTKASPWEEYLQKKKEKKKARKSERKGESAKAFSDDELPEGFNPDDEFFEKAIDEERKGKTTKDRRKKMREHVYEEDKEEQAQLSLMTLDENDGKEHFNLDKIMTEEKRGKKKKKMKRKPQQEQKETETESTFKINVQDPRFAALYQSAAYNIDPSAPDFKKTKAMDAIISEKLKRREEEEAKPRTNTKNKDVISKLKQSDDLIPKKKTKKEDSSKDIDLANLVKSVKAKTQSLKQNKKSR